MELVPLRGGSWHNDDTNLRCSARNYNNPHNHWNNNGFRVLRGLAPNHARRFCRYCLAMPGPDAGVLRNTGPVFGHDMRLSILRPCSVPYYLYHLRSKPEYKKERAALVRELNQQPDFSFLESRDEDI